MGRTIHCYLKGASFEDSLSDFLDKTSLKVKKKKYLFK